MPSLVLLSTALILATLERLPGVRFTRAPLLRTGFTSDVVYLVTGFIAGTALTLAYIVAASQALGALGVPRAAALDVPLWIAAPACLVLLDAGNYAAHLLLHRFEALWAIHKVHHSSRTLDWLATFRSHLLEQTLRRLVAPLGLIVAGAPLAAVVAAASVFNAWAMLNHANLALDLRALEPLFITPRLHRLHHLPASTDRNLGTVLTLWDRLRGSLVTREIAPDERCGVPGEIDSYPEGWWPQLREPFTRHERAVVLRTSPRFGRVKRA